MSLYVHLSAPFSDVPHRRPTIHNVVRLLAPLEVDVQRRRCRVPIFRCVAHPLVRLVRARRPLGLYSKELLLGLHDLARGRIRLDMYVVMSKARPGKVDDLLEQWHDPRRRDPVRLAQHPREIILHETLPYPRGHQHVPFDHEYEVRPCLLDGEVAKGVDGKERL